MMIKRGLLYFTIFIAVFFSAGLALNVAIRAFSPPPYMGLLSDKIETFLQNKDDINIVFIGSSRTFRQINAPLIEDRLATNGCGRKSVYNMGIPNLTYPEMRYALTKIKEAEPANLSMVIVGEPLPAVRPQLERLKIDRNRYFSDLEGTWQRLNHVWAHQEGLFDRIWRSGVTMLGLAFEQTNKGHLSRIIFPEIFASSSQTNSETENMPKDWMPLRGYYALEKPGNVNDVVLENHQRFLADIKSFDALLEEQKAEAPATDYTPNGTLVGQYEQIFTAIEEQGAIAGLYLPPLPGRVAENLALADALSAEPLLMLVYNDPQKQDRFWDAKLWYDDAHLNDEGSQILSRDIASKICTKIRNGEVR